MTKIRKLKKIFTFIFPELIKYDYFYSLEGTSYSDYVENGKYCCKLIFNLDMDYIDDLTFKNNLTDWLNKYSNQSTKHGGVINIILNVKNNKTSVYYNEVSPKKLTLLDDNTYSFVF